MIARCKNCRNEFDLLKANSFATHYRFRTKDRIPYEVELKIFCPRCGARSKPMIFEGEKAKEMYYMLLGGDSR